MRFKEWLELQESSEATRKRQQPVYPPDSDEFGSRSTSPRDLSNYKSKLKSKSGVVNVASRFLPGDSWWKHKPDLDNETGATKVDSHAKIVYHNIDPQTIFNIPIYTPQSLTMPGDDWWTHKPDDDNRPNVRFDKVDSLTHAMKLYGKKALKEV